MTQRKRWYEADIEHNGEIRTVRLEMHPHEDPDITVSDTVSMWEEGNYSCDCNRALMWCRAAGEPDPNVPCNVVERKCRARLRFEGEEPTGWM